MNATRLGRSSGRARERNARQAPTRRAGRGLATALALAALAVGGCEPAAQKPFVQAPSERVTVRSPAGATPSRARGSVLTGLDVLVRDAFTPLAGRSVAVVTNPTGVDCELRPIADLIHAAPGVRLVAIFGPEHGVAGAAEAGNSVSDSTDPRTGAKVYSLYGATRRPTTAMLKGVDTVVFDIQDIGVRAYTYLSTLVEVLHAAAAQGIEVWVLDRPVPLGGDVVEGPVLESGFESFVGAHSVPLRHGLTAGEFARLVNAEREIGARLRVVGMEGYERATLASGVARGGAAAGTRGVWIAPSPNIPDLDTALVYAGMVLIEGTNLSEGRGTTRPFRLVGAPWFDGHAIAGALESLGLPGCRFRGASFEPWFSKYRGERCGAVEVHVTDRRRYRALAVTVALLVETRTRHPDEFDIVASRFDRLAGTKRLREAVAAGMSHDDILAAWEPQLEQYRRRREKFLLYD